MNKAFLFWRGSKSLFFSIFSKTQNKSIFFKNVHKNSKEGSHHITGNIAGNFTLPAENLAWKIWPKPIANLFLALTNNFGVEIKKKHF